MNKFFSNNKQEQGQGLVEYAIILALVAIAVVASMKFFGPKLSCTYENVSNSLPGGSSNNSANNCAGGSTGVTAPSGQDFGFSYGYVGRDKNESINHYCQGYPSGTGYNVYTYESNGSLWYDVSSRPEPGESFQGTGTCP